MSNGNPHTGSSAEAALRAAVKPFRRLELTLSNPLAPVELAFGLAEAVPSVLEPAFDALNVSPLTGLPVDLFGAGLGQPESLLGGLAAAAVKGASTGRAPAKAGVDNRTAAKEKRAAERLREARGAAATAVLATVPIAPSLAPTAGVVTLGAAQGVQLLEDVADAALAAIGSAPPSKPQPARTGSAPDKALGGLLGGLAAGAAAAGAGTNGKAPQPAKKAARAAAAQGNPFEAIAETLADLALATEVNKVVPGAGRSAVAAKHGVAAGFTLLEQLADTALSLVAPSEPEHVASRAPAPPARPSAIDTLLVPAPVPPAAGERGAPGTAPPTLPNGRPAPGSDHAADPVASAPPPPQELAWLVNEALVEQARRHGVDLS